MNKKYSLAFLSALALTTCFSVTASYARNFVITPRGDDKLPTFIKEGEILKVFYTIKNVSEHDMVGYFNLPSNTQQVTKNNKYRGSCEAAPDLFPEEHCILELNITGPSTEDDIKLQQTQFVCSKNPTVCEGTDQPLMIKKISPFPSEKKEFAYFLKNKTVSLKDNTVSSRDIPQTCSIDLTTGMLTQCYDNLPTYNEKVDDVRDIIAGGETVFIHPSGKFGYFAFDINGERTFSVCKIEPSTRKFIECLKDAVNSDISWSFETYDLHFSPSGKFAYTVPTMKKIGNEYGPVFTTCRVDQKTGQLRSCKESMVKIRYGGLMGSTGRINFASDHFAYIYYSQSPRGAGLGAPHVIDALYLCTIDQNTGLFEKCQSAWEGDAEKSLPISRTRDFTINPLGNFAYFVGKADGPDSNSVVRSCPINASTGLIGTCHPLTNVMLANTSIKNPYIIKTSPSGFIYITEQGTWSGSSTSNSIYKQSDHMTICSVIHEIGEIGACSTQKGVVDEEATQRNIQNLNIFSPTMKTE